MMKAKSEEIPVESQNVWFFFPPAEFVRRAEILQLFVSWGWLQLDNLTTIWPQLASSVRCWLFVQSRWLFNASFHHANHPNHPSLKKNKHTHTHHLLLPTKNLLQKSLILSHHSDLENPELTQDVMIQMATFRWHQLVTVANPSWMFFFPWQLLVTWRRGRQFNSHALTEVFETLFFTLQTSRIAEGTAAKRIEYE